MTGQCTAGKASRLRSGSRSLAMFTRGGASKCTAAPVFDLGAPVWPIVSAWPFFSMDLRVLLLVMTSLVWASAQSQARFAECQVDLTEDGQAAGCVNVFLYQSLPTSAGTVESDCGKVAAYARGSGARGIRTSVSRNPDLPGYSATCR